MPNYEGDGIFHDLRARGLGPAPPLPSILTHCKKRHRMTVIGGAASSIA
jgi:hypothetical protein